MRQFVQAVTTGVAAATVAFVALAAQAQPTPPTPAEAVRRACLAAGGLDAFSSLSILAVELQRDETTTDGGTAKSTQYVYFDPPGPTPGRLEYLEANVVAGDDGSDGWAIAGGKPDPRPATSYMVKRVISTTLFPVMLPFSLTWDGVTVTAVSAAEVDGKPTWRLRLVFPKNFFASPQIANVWTVDVDQSTWAVVQAESPFTDLGKDIVADGMRYRWLNPVSVGGVRLPSLQMVVGLDRSGAPRPHSRVDGLKYRVITTSEGAGLFKNPIPASQRPQLPVGQPPGGGGR